VSETTFHNRRAVQIENGQLRVTVTVEGGHVAELFHKAGGVSPLWIPPWPSIEPSVYTMAKYPGYGSDSESKLLAGIMGHNLALDLFGAPSKEEAAAGITVHGEASIAPYDITAHGDNLTAKCHLVAAQLAFERHIRLDGQRVLFTETVENLSAFDRPIAWTQHVTLGPPFLERGVTQFRAPGTKSRTLEGMDFDWPLLPHKDGRKEDLQVYTSAASSAGFTTHLMDPHRDHAFFFAFSPKSGVLCGYVWKRTDFPWLGIWEENHDRKLPPWNGRSLTRGMEFGASPIPESRREMIERHTLFGMPGYRWAPAKTKLTVEYWAFITRAKAIPADLDELNARGALASR
jgi:hypothetical protein